MLDKLNKIAAMVEKMIGDQKAGKKAKKPAQPDEGSPEEEANESPDEAAAEGDAPAAKMQKSMRKAFGGAKEPGC